MTKLKNYQLVGISIVGFLITIAILAIGWLGIRPVQGSVAISNDYLATSTAASNLFGAQTAQNSLIRTGYGSLGSVVITGANTGVINFYNATTTNVNNRTGQAATSTILIASIPASAAAGTYVFDIQFTTGLIYDVYSGNVPTTTITYR